jgi:hypothetical protein
VSASCDNARLNAVSADIVHKRDKRSQSKHEERYRKECLTLGMWLASGDIVGLYVCEGEDRERERERERERKPRRRQKKSGKEEQVRDKTLCVSWCVLPPLPPFPPRVHDGEIRVIFEEQLYFRKVAKCAEKREISQWDNSPLQKQGPPCFYGKTLSYTPNSRSPSRTLTPPSHTNATYNEATNDQKR